MCLLRYAGSFVCHIATIFITIEKITLTQKFDLKIFVEYAQTFKGPLLNYCKQQIKPEIKQGDRSNVREEGGDCRGGTHDSVVRKCIKSRFLHTLLNPSGHNGFTAVERTPSSKGWSVRLLRYYSVVSLFHM